MMIANTALDDSTWPAARQEIRDTLVDGVGVCFSCRSSRQNNRTPIRLASAAR
ncbi:hypothetical protein D3C80_1976830 [compost metagenome]